MDQEAYGSLETAFFEGRAEEEAEEMERFEDEIEDTNI